MKNIIIIGGGVSGFTAAILAARKGHKVTVLERNEAPLKKLLATGNGRCNLTNLSSPQGNVFSEDTGRALEIIKGFSSEDIMRFFNGLGLALKDRNGWVYPLNDSASSAARFLILEAAALHVKVKTNETVRSITKTDGGFEVTTDTWKYAADTVVVASGSTASVKSPEAVFSEKAAEAFGIPFKPYMPALTGIKGNGSYFGKWAGVRCPAKVTLFIDEEPCENEEGELQLTDYGISGIPAFQLSIPYGNALRENKSCAFVIDFCPSMTEKEISEFIGQSLGQHKEYTLWRSLTGLLSERLSDIIAAGCKTADEAAKRVKKWEFIPKGLCGFDKAQTADGGVPLSALDIHLRSEKVPGLYFIGEACDVTGKCGGFNLTWAFASAAAFSYSLYNEYF